MLDPLSGKLLQSFATSEGPHQRHPLVAHQPAHGAKYSAPMGGADPPKQTCILWRSEECEQLCVNQPWMSITKVKDMTYNWDCVQNKEMFRLVVTTSFVAELPVPCISGAYQWPACGSNSVLGDPFDCCGCSSCTLCAACDTDRLQKAWCGQTCTQPPRDVRWYSPQLEWQIIWSNSFRISFWQDEACMDGAQVGLLRITAWQRPAIQHLCGRFPLPLKPVSTLLPPLLLTLPECWSDRWPWLLRVYVLWSLPLISVRIVACAAPNLREVVIHDFSRLQPLPSETATRALQFACQGHKSLVDEHGSPEGPSHQIAFSRLSARNNEAVFFLSQYLHCLYN